MESQDFFGEVAKQFEGGAEWSRLELVDESQYAYREQSSLASFSNMSVSGEFLKRKPLKSQGRMTENVFYSTQIIPKLSEAQPRTICLDLQLNRLEKTLGYRKNSSINPHFKRQKTLLKRLPLSNKQNGDVREGCNKDDFSITSQFLQEIKKADEQLYEIYLSLYRFQEREKEENEQIKHKIKQQDKDIHQKTIELKQLKGKLSQIYGKIDQQQKNQNKTQTNIFKSSIRQYLAIFQSQ